MKQLWLALVFAAAACAQAPHLDFPPLRPVAAPKIETFTMANGLRVFLLEHHELPLVNGLALMRTGNLFDPAEKVGLATLTGMVMRSGGAAGKSGDQLDEALENVAASVESSIGESSGDVSFSALRENVGAVLGIFHDVLTSPEFREDKIELAKTQLRSGISRRNDDADTIAGREFSETLYGKDTPYGWRIEYATLARITRADLVAFHRRYFFPANIMLAVYGDFSAPQMKAELERLFGNWDSKQPPVPPFPPVRTLPRPGIYLATKEDVTQTVFCIGHLGGLLSDPDDPALEIAAGILGGGFSSRLFRRVRSQLGYVYNIDAAWEAGYQQPGAFEITGGARAAATAATIQVVREELDKLRSAEVTDQELDTAKETVLNGFIFHFDTPAKTLMRMLRYQYHGYPEDFIFRYQKALAAVTKADVLRVARKYIRPDELTIVAVGNPAEFGKPLTSLGLTVHAIDLTIPEPPAK